MNRITNFFKRLISYDIPSNNDKANAELIRAVHRLLDKVSSMEQDTNLKLMRKYVLDGLIDVYTRTARRLVDLGEEQELERLLKIMQSNLNRIGVGIKISTSGSEFDHETMTICEEEPLFTNNIDLANKVSISVVPLFTWDVPVEGRDNLHLVLKKEEVILWQYTDQTIFQDSPQVKTKNGDANTIVQKIKNPVTVSSLVTPKEMQWKKSKAIGYLVVIENDEIVSILTVDPIIKNVYGARPEEHEGISIHPISLLNDQLADEHFTIKQDSKSKQLEAVLLNGQWSVNSKNNSVPRTMLSDGDTIYIGSISFKYIENVS
jgi:hypothetical protein